MKVYLEQKECKKRAGFWKVAVGSVGMQARWFQRPVSMQALAEMDAPDFTSVDEIQLDGSRASWV